MCILQCCGGGGSLTQATSLEGLLSQLLVDSRVAFVGTLTLLYVAKALKAKSAVLRRWLAARCPRLRTFGEAMRPRRARRPGRPQRGHSIVLKGEAAALRREVTRARVFLRQARAACSSFEERCNTLCRRGSAALMQMEHCVAEMQQVCQASQPEAATGSFSPVGSMVSAPFTPESRRETGNGWPRCTPSFGLHAGGRESRILPVEDVAMRDMPELWGTDTDTEEEKGS